MVIKMNSTVKTNADAALIADIATRCGDGEAALITVDAVDGVSYCVASAAQCRETASTLVYEATTPDCDPPALSTLRAVWVVEPGRIIDYMTSDAAGLDEVLHEYERTTNPVDEIVAQAMKLDGASFDELRTRLADMYDVIGYTGLPDGGVIVYDGERYTSSLDGSPTDQTGFDEYCDALDRLRVAIDDALILNPDDVPLTFVSMVTGVKIELPPLSDISVNFDRPAKPEHAEFWRLAEGATGVEAFCALCGECFNPHGADDMTHGQRASDEQPCGGPGVPVGWWH